MHQRPSLVWPMLGTCVGVSPAWRQVMRNSGARRITQDITSSSGFFDDRLMHRAGEVLAFAGVQPVQQRGEDADHQLLAGDVVGVPELRRDRRQVVALRRVRIVAAVHHDPAEGEMHQVAALEVPPRPGIAEGRHPGDDQPRMPRPQRRDIEVAPRGQQDVGPRQQRLALGALQRAGHGALAPVVGPEMQRPLRPRRRRRGRARSAASRRPPAAPASPPRRRGRPASARSIPPSRRRSPPPASR